MFYPFYYLDYSNSKLPWGFLKRHFWRSTQYVLAQEGYICIHLFYYTIGPSMCKEFAFSVWQKLCCSLLAVNHWWIFWFWNFVNIFQPEKFQLLPAPGSNRSKKGAKQQQYNGNQNSHHTNLEHRPSQGVTAKLVNLQPTYKRPSPAALASAAQAEKRALATAELNKQQVINEIQENNLLKNSPPRGGSPASTISDRFVPINFDSL